MEAGMEPCSKLPPVPDLGNRRFCRACEKTLPIEAFPAGTRRYLCRRHMYLRVKKPSKERALADPHKKLFWVLWKRCWSDARRVFGQAGVGVTQGEIAATLAGLNASSGVVDDNTQHNLAVIPKDPTQPVSRANMVIVGCGDRKRLIKVLRKDGAVKYQEELENLPHKSL